MKCISLRHKIVSHDSTHHSRNESYIRAVVTTTVRFRRVSTSIRLRFDRRLTPIRLQFDDLRYVTYCGASALRPK